MTVLFDEVQLRTLRAAMDRLIPADEFPGAWDAGCGDYLQNQLSGQLADLLPIYRAGLDGLEAEARVTGGRGFADLEAELQDAILGRAELGVITADWSTPAKPFFVGLANHTAEGYYADPGQGGNRDRISWKMVGFRGK